MADKFSHEYPAEQNERPRSPVIYIKPMTWAGKLKFYVGLQPSDATRSPGYQLGSYFIVCSSLEQAQAIAHAEARRVGGCVVECPHYVGYYVIDQHEPRPSSNDFFRMSRETMLTVVKTDHDRR